MRATMNRINAATSLIVVSGALDSASSDRMRTLLNEVVNTGCRNLVINCRDVNVLDTAGLQNLVQASVRLRAVQGQVYLVQPSTAVTRSLELTNSAEKFTTVKSESEAYRAAGL